MGGLLRYQIFLGYAAAFLSAWYLALTRKEEPNLAIDYAPLWAILALGVYAAGSVIIGVATFESHPEAAAELEKEVAEAKAALKKRGILQ